MLDRALRVCSRTEVRRATNTYSRKHCTFKRQSYKYWGSIYSWWTGLVFTMSENQGHLVRILEDALLFVNPYHTITLLNVARNVLLNLLLFFVRKGSNIALRDGSIDKTLHGTGMVVLVHFLYRTGEVLVPAGHIESLSPEAESEVGTVVFVLFDSLAALLEPGCTGSVLHVPDESQRSIGLENAGKLGHGSVEIRRPVEGL